MTDVVASTQPPSLNEVYPHLFEGEKLEWLWTQMGVNNMKAAEEFSALVLEDPLIQDRHRYSIMAAVRTTLHDRRGLAGLLIGQIDAIYNQTVEGVPFLNLLENGNVMSGYFGGSAVQSLPRGLAFTLSGREVAYPADEDSFPRFKTRFTEGHQEVVSYMATPGLSRLSSLLQGNTRLLIGIDRIAEALRYSYAPQHLFAKFCLRATGIELAPSSAERMGSTIELKQRAVDGLVRDLNTWVKNKGKRPDEFSPEAQPAKEVRALAEMLGLGADELRGRLSAAPMSVLQNLNSTLWAKREARYMLQRVDELIADLFPDEALDNSNEQ